MAGRKYDLSQTSISLVADDESVISQTHQGFVRIHMDDPESSTVLDIPNESLDDFIADLKAAAAGK